MCLAIPPTNRNQSYAIPFASPIPKSSSFSKASDSSSPSVPGAARRSLDNRRSSGQKFDNIQNTFGDPLVLPKTPPPLDVVGSFADALGPTGLTLTDHFSPGFIPRIDPDNLAAIPRIPISHYSLASAPKATVATSARRSQSTKQRRRRAPQRPGKTATDKERLFVKHDYHDLSAEPDGLQWDDTAKNNGRHTSASANLADESFPMKIHRILEEANDDSSQNHIISWQPHGRAFKIRNPKLFTERIMPRYFPKMKKLTSLQRQFNLYGFERLAREGPDTGAYYHEAFLRYRPGLSARRMVRRRIKGTGYKAASNPDAEPDFYALPFMQAIMNTTRNKHEGEGAASASHGRQQQFSVFPVTSHPFATVAINSNDQCSHTSGFPQQPYNGGAIKDQDTVAGIVTESTKSSSFSSYDSCSSEETLYHHQKASMQLVPSPSPSGMTRATTTHPVLTHFLPQAVVHSNSPSPVDTGRNNPDRRHDSTSSPPSMDYFLSLPEATQDSFLRDFFATNDVTPLVPGFDPANTNIASTGSTVAASCASQPQHQQNEDHEILLEFADIWESSSTHHR